MANKTYDFSIIFKEVDRLSKEEISQRITEEELADYEAIRKFGEIVTEINTPIQSYVTTT